MEREISTGTMLGITLIALAAIIGIGFGIFSIARSTANEGVMNIQDNLKQVNASVFTDYDQRIVTGTQVKSAYDSLAGKPYAILIATQAYIDKSTLETIQGLSNAPKISAYSGNVGSTTAMKAQTSVGKSVNLKFLNYNAILGGGTAGTCKIYYKDGLYLCTSGFDLNENGAVNYNFVIGNLSLSGAVEYIAPTSRFQANLIKGPGGEIIGIAFQQVKIN